MKSDLISKRDLISFIDKKVVPGLLLLDNASGAGIMAGFSEILEEADVIPTIDAMPIVRCRDCMHCLWDELHKDRKGRCMEHHLWCEPDGFCHMGEKMDGGAEG